MTMSDVLASADFAVVTSLYPGTWRLTAEVLRTRVGHYRAAGLQGVVVHYSPEYEGDPHVRQDPVAPIIGTPPAALPEVLHLLRAAGLPALAHAPTAEALPHLQTLIPHLGLWLHETLTIDYRRLATDFTSAELNARRGELDADNVALRRGLRPLFNDDAVPVVSAFEHQRRLAEFDVDTPATNGHVIPHHVAAIPELARVRHPEEARSLLLMTASDEHHAGGDIAVRALEMLSSRHGFNDLSITILGGGPAAGRSPLATMRNVRVMPSPPGPAERTQAAFDHGVLLSPSRWNAQDPVLMQAMAQGMVAVTHPVGGTPEYVDDSCAVLPRAGDPWAFAEAVWDLVHHPEAMPTLSRNALQRVTTQCSWQDTIARDVELIRGLAP